MPQLPPNLRDKGHRTYRSVSARTGPHHPTHPNNQTYPTTNVSLSNDFLPSPPPPDSPSNIATMNSHDHDDGHDHPQSERVDPLWLYGYGYFSVDSTLWSILMDLEYQMMGDSKQARRSSLVDMNSIVIPNVSSSVVSSGSSSLRRKPELNPQSIDLVLGSFTHYKNADLKECLNCLQEFIRMSTERTPSPIQRYSMTVAVSLFLIVSLNYSTILSTQYHNYHTGQELLRLGQDKMMNYLEDDHLKVYFSSLYSVAYCNYYRKCKKYERVKRHARDAYEGYSRTGSVVYGQYLLQLWGTSCMYVDRMKQQEALECFRNNMFLYDHQTVNVHVKDSMLEYFNGTLSFISDHDYFVSINRCFNMYNYGVALYDGNEHVKARYYMFQSIEMMNRHVTSQDTLYEKRWLKQMIHSFRVVSKCCETIASDVTPLTTTTPKKRYNQKRTDRIVDPFPFKNNNYYIATMNKAIHYLIQERQKQELLFKLNMDEDEYKKIKKLISIMPLLQYDAHYERLVELEREIEKPTIPQQLDQAKAALKSSKIFLTPISKEVVKKHRPQSARFEKNSNNTCIKLSPIRPNTGSIFNSTNNSSFRSGVLNFSNMMIYSPHDDIQSPPDEVALDNTTFGSIVDDEERNRAALIIQKCAKKFLAKCRVSRMRREAKKKMEDELRREREEYSGLIEEMNKYQMTHAIVVIQTAVRQFLARRFVKRRMMAFQSEFKRELEQESIMYQQQLMQPVIHV